LAKDIKQDKDGIYDSYFKWIIVRNPWEREISMYKKAQAENLINMYSFEDYLEALSNNQINNPFITRNQIDYFTEDGVIIVDKILRMEFLNQGWENFCTTHQQNKRQVLKQNNQSRGEYISYNKKTKSLLESIRGEDIEFLGYSFN